MNRLEGSFAPGDGVAVVAEVFSALVLAERTSPAVDLLVEAAFGADGAIDPGEARVERVLDELGRLGFEHLPPLGIVSWESGLCRLVLRGGVSAEITDSSSDEPALVESDGIRTWSEHVLTDAASVTLRNRSETVDVGFWTAGGVVAASALRCVERVVHLAPIEPPAPVTAALDAEEQVEEEVAPVELVRDDAVSGADQVLGNDPAHGAESGDEHDEDHGDDDVAAETLLPDELPSDAEPVAAEEPDADGDASPSVESSETGGAARSGEQDAAAEDPAGDPADPAAMIEAVPSGNAGAGVAAATDDPAGSADGGYDHLFGSTVVRSVEGAAVRDGDAADESGEQPPTKDHGDPTDHDGLTVTVAELRRIRAAGNADARSPSVRVAPSVDGEHLARQCSGGHLNPPSATACRICGLAVEGEPFRTDRIELGSIRFSTGRIVPLSGTILIGRSPKPPLVKPGDSRRAVELVEVPSPQQDISRNHVELRVDGWQVLVTDLGSTNGTVITIPGRDPQRLRSNESFPLPAGATVNLADEVQFAYEVGP